MIGGGSLRKGVGDPRAQMALFVVSAVGGGLLGIASQALVARQLGVDSFAVYAFCLALLQFSAVLFEFGLFIPAARSAALAPVGERPAVIGAALVVFVPVGIAFCLLTFALSFVIDGLVDFEPGGTLRIAALLAFVFPFMLIGQALAQGVARLHVFSLTSLAWQALFAALLLAVLLLNVDFGSEDAVLGREAAMAVGVILISAWLRPRLVQVRDEVRRLARDAREYGWSIYVGRVLSTGSYNMDVLLVGFFAGVDAVAFYTLAKLLAYGVGLPGTGASGALFSRMASMPRLNPRWLRIVVATGVGLAVLLAAIASPIIDFAYGDEFSAAVGLVLPLALAEAIRGVAALYNQFLNAHGQGEAIRAAGVVFTVTNVVVNFTLIPLYGAPGAAWASVIAMVANLAMHVRGYNRMPREPSPL